MPSMQNPGRRPLIAANWKMFKTISETEAFLKSFLSQFPKGIEADVVICPTFTSLETAGRLLKGSAVSLGAQNLNENKSGAYTGEISGSMLVAAGCQYVIIGHSERRQYFGETDSLVNKKIKAAFENNLTPIACVGESLAEREANKTIEVVSRQVKAALEGLPSQNTQRIVIAYEPIWAIGTGKTATTAQAQEVHLAIRDILKDQYGSSTAHAVRILYGGSVKPDNMAALMSQEDIDGGLVGGASLEPESFVKIVSDSRPNAVGK
jgi:triosephosphate isomerase (TIM)